MTQLTDATVAAVTEDEIDEVRWTRWMRNPASGAVVCFAGVVRDHDEGRRVIALEYSAHPSADAVIKATLDTVLDRHPAVTAAAVLHRIGQLRIGDTALLVCVAAPHRREAFAAAEEIVEQVKQSVPIWKQQTYDDGSSHWVGCP